LDDSLIATWQQLLLDDLEQIKHRIGMRLIPDLEGILYRQQRVVSNSSDKRHLRLQRALEVRNKRLQRDITELNSLLQSDPKAADNDLLLQQVQQRVRVRSVFQRGLNARM
jgi:hypothetical protein